MSKGDFRTKWILGFLLALLFASLSTSVFHVEPVEAIGTISILADGSINPPSAPISTNDNVTYTLIDDVVVDSGTSGIAVDRDNIVIDGGGFMLRGSSAGNGTDFSGIDLTGTENVTIRNMQISRFDYGVWLDSSFYDSVVECNVTANVYCGICLNYSSNNSVFGNIGGTIALAYCSGNNIAGNDLTYSYGGVALGYSSDNQIFGNNVACNSYGLSFLNSSNNVIYHNSIITNTRQVYDAAWDYPQFPVSFNAWDSDYPLGGNYWSDFNCSDHYFGVSQNLNGSDGIADTEYSVNLYNKDRYPLTSPYQYWSNPILGDVNRDMRVDMHDIVDLVLAFDTFLNSKDNYYWHTTECMFCPHCPILDLDNNGIISMDDIVAGLYHFGKYYLP